MNIPSAPGSIVRAGIPIIAGISIFCGDTKTDSSSTPLSDDPALPTKGGAECQVQNGFASSRGGACS
jgi:hypothetical protein